MGDTQGGVYDGPTHSRYVAYFCVLVPHDILAAIHIAGVNGRSADLSFSCVQEDWTTLLWAVLGRGGI